MAAAQSGIWSACITSCSTTKMGVHRLGITRAELEHAIPRVVTSLTSLPICPGPCSHGRKKSPRSGDPEIFRHSSSYFRAGFWDMTRRRGNRERSAERGLIRFDISRKQWDNMRLRCGVCLPEHRWIESDVTIRFFTLLRLEKIDFTIRVPEWLPASTGAFRGERSDGADCSRDNNTTRREWEGSDRGYVGIDPPTRPTESAGTT